MTVGGIFVKIRVMNYNIHHGKGKDKQLDLNRITEVINASEAEIIGLTEVDRHFSRRSHFTDQVAYLARQLGLEYAFSPSIDLKSKKGQPNRQFGNALLSKYPIMELKSHPLNFFRGPFEGRSMLDAKIIVENKPLNICITHLSLNPFLNRRQLDYIMSHLRSSPTPVILMGDMNMLPKSKSWRMVTEGLQDVWSIKGTELGNTYPSSKPKLRLDYIFCDQAFKVIEADVFTINRQASDHLPVVATLKLN